MTWRCWTTIIFVLVFATGSSSFAANTPAKSGAQRRVASTPINDFQLIDQHGAPFVLENLSGRVVVVAFVYTSCPDVCPLITASLRQVQIGLGAEERQKVHLLTVTTDPEIDQPKVLLAYGKRYSADFANWSFLTGEPTTLKKVWQNFGVGVKRKGRGLVDHTPLTAIVDQKRLLRFGYIGPSPDPSAVLSDIRALLAERASTPAH
jgi:protein SCO1/2